MSLDVEINPTAQQQAKCMSKARIMKNLIIVCLGFFFLFCAFQSLANLQTTINHQGSESQSVIYVAFAVSSLLFPKLMISKLGCKTTLVVSMLAYIPFMASNYFRNFLSRLLTSVLVGLGGGTLWSSGCTYINEISALYSAAHGADGADVTTTKFFGIFFMIFQNSQIWGNLASFYVLKPTSAETTFEMRLIPSEGGVTATHVANVSAVTCGVEFCGGVNENLAPLSEDKRFVLITVYLAFTVFAAVVMAAFLDSLPRKEKSGEDSNVVFAKLTATLKHLRKSNQLLLVPLTVFLGLEQAFILSDFSQGYVACSWGLYNVSLVFICFGVVSAIAAFVTGRISKYVPRLVIILTAAAGNFAACTIMFLWNPDSKDVIHFFIIISLWGISDAIWQTEISSMYGIMFRIDEEAAFGNLRLWEAVGFFIPYFCNKLLCMFSKLYLVIAVLATGLLGYIIVEIKTSIKKKVFVLPKK